VPVPLDPLDPPEEAAVVVEAAATDVEADLEPAAVELAADPAAIVEPVLLMTATLAKFVVIPKAALNASACAPVPTGALFAAFVAAVHVVSADEGALHASFSCWQMKLVIVVITSSDP
jgi:hypothetical protein